MTEATVLGKHSAPKSTGVCDFDFPVYCVEKNSAGKRLKRVFVTWQPSKHDQALKIKEWRSFSWLPEQLKTSAQPLLETLTAITPEQLDSVVQKQQSLWNVAYQNAQAQSQTRAFDRKRKLNIEYAVRGKKLVSVPTCAPEPGGCAYSVNEVGN